MSKIEKIKARHEAKLNEPGFKYADAFHIKDIADLLSHIESQDKKLAKAVGTLRNISGYDSIYSGQKEGICPYGCDTPKIAKETLAKLGKED